jgi:CCDC81-like prokaryotic HU domain 1/SPOR domain
MLNIQREIENIVFEQDFVVLPGIGAFLTEYTKPYFDKKGDIVLPEKKIEFNQLIDRDLDEKLFHLISKNTHLPKELIASEYNDFINKFRSSVVLNHKYEWESLGIFFKNDNQELVFYPESKALGSFKNNEAPEKPILAAKIPESNELHTALEQEIEEIDEELESPHKKPRAYFKILLYAIPLFLITSTLAYTIFIKPLKNESEKKNMVEEIDSLTDLQKEVLDDSSLKKEEKKEESQKKAERNTSDNDDTLSLPSTKEHIVGIGIFKVKENVDNLAAYLAENGIPARVRRYGKSYKLFVTANSEEQANEFVQKIEQLTGEKAVYENN